MASVYGGYYYGVTSRERAGFPHRGITATVFWAGEGADQSNDFIHNRSSTWVGNWVGGYGGVDDPEERCGYHPCKFTPRENPFYFALPYSDYNDFGLKPDAELRIIPWYAGAVEPGASVVKNRWIKIRNGEKIAYAQWEDVGPFKNDDVDYVFGSAEPRNHRAGIDLSPALADYLTVGGRGKVDWIFVEESEVADGPWKEIITRTNPDWP